MTVERFEDLEIWQEARTLSKVIFQLTNRKPFESDFKLKGQIKGSSGSRMDIIAEDFERNGRKKFLQFLSIAKGFVTKPVLRLIVHLTMNTSQKKN